MPTDPATGRWSPAPEQRTLPPEDPAAERAEIDEAAEVTGEDADAGVRFWEANAPAEFKGLADAAPYEGDG